VFRSLLDALGIGVGFTLSLMALAAVRELLGTGMLTIWVTPIQIFGPSFQPFSFMVEAPGAFMALGLMLCLMNLVGKK
jgi:electron transport complex protein RnfE